MQITITKQRRFFVIENAEQAQAALAADIATTYITTHRNQVILFGDFADTLTDTTFNLDDAVAFRKAADEQLAQKATRDAAESAKMSKCQFCHYCGHPVSNDHGFFGEPVCDNCR